MKPPSFIAPLSVTKRILFYLQNFEKMFEQYEDWAFKRFECVQESNWTEAERIEKVYLQPLQRKISSLAITAREDISNG